MSARLYTTGLFWYSNGTGIAKLHNVSVYLTLPPDLGWGQPFDGLTYIPEVGMRRWRPMGEDWADMPDGLVRACDDYLRRTVPKDGGKLG